MARTHALRRIPRIKVHPIPMIQDRHGDWVTRRGGLAQSDLTAKLENVTASDTFQRARETISPWIWVFSLTGFYFAMRNRHQIKKMYGSWKKAKR